VTAAGAECQSGATGSDAGGTGEEVAGDVAPDMGVFVGGVLYMRLAWVMDFSPFVARVRAGRKHHLPLGLLLC
jgi:hypothetical protein